MHSLRATVAANRGSQHGHRASRPAQLTANPAIHPVEGPIGRGVT
jgi:hypothetical protein